MYALPLQPNLQLPLLAAAAAADVAPTAASPGLLGHRPRLPAARPRPPPTSGPAPLSALRPGTDHWAPLPPETRTFIGRRCCPSNRGVKKQAAALGARRGGSGAFP